KRENPQTGRTYDPDGLAPTLNTMQGGNLQPQIVEPKLEFVGGLKEDKKWLDDGKDNSRNFSQGSRVYDSRGLATALTAQGVGGKGGHSGLYKVPEPKIAASRGRGANNEQQLEVNKDDTSNALTTVEKDNYVLESEPTIVDAIYNNREPRVYDEYAPTLRSERHGLDVVNNYRIRKHTPLECC